MEYTTSDAYATHTGTGHRMHQANQPVPTEVSDRDMNMVVWSLMEFLNEAGLTPSSFNPGDSATYRKLYEAVFGRLAGLAANQGAGLLGASPSASYPPNTAGKWLKDLQASVVALEVFAATGIVGYLTKAVMDADLAHPAGTVGYVTNDSTPANNGVYLKQGASGAGSWTPSSSDRTTLVEGRVTAIENDLAGSVKPVTSPGVWYVVDKYGRAAVSVASDGSVTVAYLTPQTLAFGGVETQASSSGYLVTVDDKYGRVALGVRPAGSVDVGELLAQSVTTQSLTVDSLGFGGVQTRAASSAYLVSVEDAYGRVALGVAEDGRVDMGDMAAQSLAATAVSAQGVTADVVTADTLRYSALRGDLASVTPLPDIVGFISYGQSWTVGFDSQPALSLTQRFNNVMFNGGVRSQSISDDPAVVYTSLVPLVERNDGGTPGFPSYPCGETYCASQTDSFCERLADENANSIPMAGLQMFASCPGEGDKKIEELSHGTTYYARLITQVQHAFDLAQAAGKSFTVPAISWVQNTASTGFGVDGGTAAYPALLEQLRADLDADIRAITGQAETLKLIIWQMFPDGNTAANRADQVYARHVLSANTYPHIYCVGGSYFLDQDTTSPGAVHLKNESQRWLGAQLGLVAKRVVVDGIDWKPVQPLAVKKNGRIVTVRFNVPQGKLVFDTTRVALAENFGFNAYTSGGTELPISSVSIVNRDTVRIVMPSAPPAGAVLRYASKGTQQGRLIGIRGNLRDTQGDQIQYLGLPLHNWCVCFQETIL